MNSAPASPREAGVNDPGYNKTQQVRPFYWSVRREVWENRSLYFGPLIVAVFVLLGLFVRLHDLPERRRAALALNEVKARHAIELPYDAAIGMLMVAAFIIGAFYCLDALYGERRERSILFWKSLPVSDATTVLSKLAIPLIVLPLVCIPLSVCLHLIWLLVSSVVLLMGGVSPATTFAHLPLFQLWIAMIYSWICLVLWHAPIYAWLLLVSGWARRTPFLWALLPLVAVGIFERVAFGTQYVSDFIRYRVVGWFYHAFALAPKDTAVEPLAQLTPGGFLSTPGLWLGLLSPRAFLSPPSVSAGIADPSSHERNHTHNPPTPNPPITLIAALSVAASALAQGERRCDQAAHPRAGAKLSENDSPSPGRAAPMASRMAKREARADREIRSDEIRRRALDARLGRRRARLPPTHWPATTKNPPNAACPVISASRTISVPRRALRRTGKVAPSSVSRVCRRGPSS